LTDHRRANRAADDGIFCDGCIFDASRAVLIIKAFGYGIRAAPNADLFTHNKDCGVAVHFFHKSLRDRLAHCDFCHV
jgi:hypothetical protein